MSPTLASIDVW